MPPKSSVPYEKEAADGAGKFVPEMTSDQPPPLAAKGSRCVIPAPDRLANGSSSVAHQQAPTVPSYAILPPARASRPQTRRASRRPSSPR